ncbi:RluA family pseudouridine synthase, partial [bacterium]|nr:RluA family pseudouridine synthase [bacterium]
MTEKPPLRVRIPPGTSPERLDRALARELAGEESRSSIQRLIREGRVLVNGRPVRAATEVGPGDEVVIDRPEPVPADLPAQDLEFGIVHEDDAIVVVDKPAGMVTHPAEGTRSGTLVNALLHRVRDLSGIGGVLRPGIVHRLDKGTTGLLVVAKTDEAHRRLAAQLAERTLKRIYVAVAWGCVQPESFVIDAPIGRHPRDRKRMGIVEGGKEARTHIRVLRATELASHVEAELETGRTHQIRVHLRHVGHPLVGDSAYGGRRRAIRTAAPEIRRAADALIREIDRPALHARRLRLIHPVTGE